MLLLFCAWSQKRRKLTPRSVRLRQRFRPMLELLEQRLALSTSIPLNSSSWTDIGPAPINQSGALQGGDYGYGPLSGRVTGLATDPGNASIIYAATSGGGVWKTTDGGTSWAPLTDHVLDGSSNPVPEFMGAVALAPSNSSVIYAGTGDANYEFISHPGDDSHPGDGVLVSTDGGNSWTLTGQSVFNGASISQIAIDPLDPRMAWVAVADFGQYGIWKTTDQGATWVNTTKSIDSLHPWSSVVIDPRTSTVGGQATLFAAVGDPFNYVFSPSIRGTANIYESTDSGATWSVLTNLPGITTAGRIDLAISHPAANPQATVYASLALAQTGGPNAYSLDALDVSTDGGATWTQQTNTPDFLNGSGWFDNVVMTDPNNPQLVYAAGRSADVFNPSTNTTSYTRSILESFDGGQTWYDLTQGTVTTNGLNGPATFHHALAVDAIGRLVDGNEGGVWRLDTNIPLGGEIPGLSTAWTNLNANLEVTQLVGLALDPTNANIVYGGGDLNGTEQFNDNRQWNRIDFSNGGVVRVDPTNPQTIYHTTYFGGRDSNGTLDWIRRSTDGGLTWTNISAGVNLQDAHTFYPPMVIDPNNHARLLLATDKLYVTPDGGGTGGDWTVLGTAPLAGTPIDSIAIAPSDSNTIYVGVGNQVYVSTNGGQSWALANPQKFAGPILGIAVDPTNSQTAYLGVAASNNCGGQVWQTTNGGQSWADISGIGLPEVSVNAVLLFSGQLFVGTDAGVYATNAVSGSSTAWARYRAGLPNVRVEGLDAAVINNQPILAAGTFGRGAFEIQVGSTGDFPLTITSLTPPAATEGLTTPRAVVATFTDGDSAPNPADLTAIVSWGDCGEDTLTVANGGIVRNADGTFSLVDSHVYAEEGKGLLFAVEVADVGGSIAYQGTPIDVADAALTIASVTPPPATEGQAFGNVTIAHFTDADPAGTVSDYTAVVALGDGNTVTLTSIAGTNGQIVADPNGGFDVQLSYTYAEELQGQFDMTVSDVGGAGEAAALLGFSVADAPLTIKFVTPPSATEGQAFSNVRVAHFTDADPAGSVGDYTAVVTLGDGNSVTLTSTPGAFGQIVANPNGGFDVQLSYTYAEELRAPFDVSVFDVGGASYSAAAVNFSVADAPLTITSLTPPSATEGQPLSNVVVAHFTDADPTGTVSDYRAVISLGDGQSITLTSSPSAFGQIVANGGGFDVQLSYTYAEELQGQFGVSVSDQGAAPGFGPVAAALGDFNGDGKPDLVVANQDKGIVSVLLGNGDGTFQLPQCYPIGFDPFAVAVADVNGDGKLDLIVAGSAYNEVSVLLGNGDGTFQQPQPVNVGVSPYTLSVADVNGDGKPDLIVGDSKSKTVSVVLGNGNGTFQSPQLVNVGVFIYSVAVADVSGDGKLDLIVGDLIDSDVSVLLGNGNGTFQAPQLVPVGTYPSSIVAVADVNGDGKPDLVVAYRYDDEISVLLGNGNGTFQAPQTVDVTFNPRDLVLADVNGDGKPDLVLTNYYYNTVSVLLGNGNGTFGQPQTYATGEFPTSVVVGDVNGNGKPDLIAVNQDDSTVSVFLGNGDGTFQPQQVFATGIAFQAANFSVADAPLTIASVTPPPATEGVAFSNVTIAHFTDADPAGTPSDYTATVSLGDGNFITLTSSPSANGQVAANPNGGFDVQLSYTYADELSNSDFAVLITDAGGSYDHFNSNLNVADADTLSGTGAAIAMVEQTAFVGTVATFIDTNAAANASDFTAIIDWGDGTTTAGTVSGSQGGTFTVSGSHAYAEDGPYTTTITLIDDSPGTATTSIHGTAQVAEDSFGLNGVTPISTTEGQSFSGAVATFTDPSSPDAASAFTATINWGDGSTTTGTVSGSAGNYTVSGSHTYAEEGNFSATVTVAEPSANFTTGPQSDAVSVAEGDSFVSTGLTIQPTEGQSFRGTVATFTDQGYPGQTAADFSATIDWGDGITTTGTISGSAGNFTVSGDHTYAEESLIAGAESFYSIQVTLTDDAPGSLKATAFSTAFVFDAALTITLFTPPSATEGQPLQNVTVAHFVDADPNGTANDYTAVINLGDGHSVTLTSRLSPNGQIVANPNGGFDVQLSYTYAEELQDQFRLSVFDYGVPPPLRPRSVAEGDFNGDGKPDLAVANQANGTVSVLLANGNSDFQLPQSYFVGSDPVSVAVGDFNGDGKPDLAVANFNDNTISILLNNGDGTFGLPQNIPVGGGPISVVVADFNGDGKPDLAVANSKDNTVTILLGDGHGGFQTEQTLATGTDPHYLALGDFNHDNHPDLVAANAESDTVSVFLNNGNGTFQPQRNYFSGRALEVAVGDFNGDGNPDLAVVNGENNTLAVLLGNPDGSFQSPQTYATGKGPDSVAVGDLNGDRIPDLVVANQNADTLTVFLGDGKGSFQPLEPTPTGFGPVSIVISDFNGDGVADVAVANGDDSTIIVYPGYGDGFFQYPFTFVTGGATAAGGFTVEDAPLQITSLTPPSPTEGQAFSNGTVAHFTDLDPAGTATDYTAVVNLGDGNTVTLRSTPSANGRIVANPNGGFDVQLSCTYAEENAGLPFVVTVSDAGGSVASMAGTVRIADAPLSLTLHVPTGLHQRDNRGLLPVATFTDGNPGADIRDFTAVVTWGDGNSDTITAANGIVANPDGTFSVLASHVYLLGAQGLTFRVLVTDAGGAHASSSGQIQIGPASTVLSTQSFHTIFSTNQQAVIVIANVGSAAGTVDEGNVTFQLDGMTQTAIVDPGTAVATFILPADLAATAYTVTASYRDNLNVFNALNWDASSISAIVTIDPAQTQTAVENFITGYTPFGEGITLTAPVNSPAGVINEGSVTFNVAGLSVTALVHNGTATATLDLPPVDGAGTYAITASYADGTNTAGGVNLTSSLGSGTLTLVGQPTTPTLPVFLPDLPIPVPTPAPATSATPAGGAFAETVLFTLPLDMLALITPLSGGGNENAPRQVSIDINSPLTLQASTLVVYEGSEAVPDLDSVQMKPLGLSTSLTEADDSVRLFEKVADEAPQALPLKAVPTRRTGLDVKPNGGGASRLPAEPTDDGPRNPGPGRPAQPAGPSARDAAPAAEPAVTAATRQLVPTRSARLWILLRTWAPWIAATAVLVPAVRKDRGRRRAEQEGEAAIEP